MKKIMFLSSLIIVTLTLHSQSVQSQLYIKLRPLTLSEIIADTMPFAYSNMLDITQKIQLKNYEKDSLFLQLKVGLTMPILASVCFHKIAITSKIGKENLRVSFVFLPFDSELKFAVPNKNCEIEIHYFYQPDYFGYTKEQFNSENFVACSSVRYLSSQSWYFTTHEMKLDKVVWYNIPENLYFFSNVPQNNTQKGIELQVGSMQNWDLSFMLLEKECYEKVVINNYTLFLQQQQHLIDYTGNSQYILANRTTSKDNCIAYIAGFQTRLESIFDKKVNVFVIDDNLNWTTNGFETTSGYGNQIDNENGWVVFDESFWQHSSALHEIIHLYNTTLPERTDSSYYLFNEALVEYLANLLFYTSDRERDSIYEQKMLKYSYVIQDFTSIFEIKENKTYFDTKKGETVIKGSLHILYAKTPFVLHCFEKKIGSDKMLEILSMFFHQIKGQDATNLQDFLDCFRTNGVSEDNIEWLMKYL